MPGLPQHSVHLKEVSVNQRFDLINCLSHLRCCYRGGNIRPGLKPGSVLLCLALLLGTVPVVQAETRIGFVDIPYLIDKAPQALEAERRLEMEFAPRQEDIRQLREELAALNERLKLEGLGMSESAAASLDRQVRGLERRIKRDEMDFREELNIQKNNEFKKVRILVLEAIAAFGKTNNFDLIVSDGVLYANKQVDVTEKILDSLVNASDLLQSSS